MDAENTPGEDYADGVVAAWSTALPDVDVTPVGMVVRLHQVMLAMEEFDRRSVGGTGLSAAEYMVLTVLAVRPATPGLTLRQLQPLVMYSSGGMTHCVDRLVDKGLVERRPHPQDRRSVLVALTPEGHERAEEVMRGRIAAFEELLGPLSPHEREMAGLGLRVLSRMLAPWTPSGRPLKNQDRRAT